MSNSDTLPIIDFAPFQNGRDKQAVARSIDAAIRQYGFFYLKNHGLSAPMIEACFHQAGRFFDLPRAEKQALHISQSPCHRGWYYHGDEVLDAKNQPEGDYKEGLKIGHDLPATHPFVVQKIPLHGANNWGGNWGGNRGNNGSNNDAFKQAMQTAYADFSHLAHELMCALALALGLAENHFDAFLDCPMATLSPIRYPPLKNRPNNADVSAGAHTDFGCLTLLCQRNIGGLDVQTKGGAWIEVPPIDGTLVVNIGDMLEFWTAGAYKSTKHRVRNISNETRNSLAFFYDPQYDTPLEALSGARKNEPPKTALEHLLEKISTSFYYEKT